MTWFKVDDKIAFHPKVVRAGNAAMGLWLRAGAWSADQQTDGLIPDTVITVLGGKPSEVRALLNAGLWTKEDTAYRMHDWQDYQPTRAEKSANQARGTLGAHRRWHTLHPSPDCAHCHAERKATP